MIDMSDTATLPEVATKDQEKVLRQPPYHVILHNDDDHTFEYVIRMLKELFGHQEETGFLMAKEVHEKGRVIVCTTPFHRPPARPNIVRRARERGSPGRLRTLSVPTSHHRPE